MVGNWGNGNTKLVLREDFGQSAVKRREQKGVSGGATRPAAAYLRGEQGETDRVQSG